MTATFPDSGPQAALPHGVVHPLGHPPCSRACPVGTDVKGYVTAIASGRYERAEAIARRSNPLASTAARICARPCEAVCSLADEKARAVPIRSLKAFVCDFTAQQGHPSEVAVPPPQPIRGASVAIVGAGPAGLAAARDLARAGAKVLLIDASTQPGGLLASHVPDFRLPRAALERDVETIFAWGVRFQGNSPTDGEALQRLLADNDAVVLATGAHLPVWPSPFREVQGAEGLTTPLELLGGPIPPPLPDGAAVVGAEPPCVAAARALARAGWSVRLLVPGPEEEASADPADLLADRADGVEVHTHVSVGRVRTLADRVSGLELTGLGAGSRFLPASLVVVGTWRRPDWPAADLPEGVCLTRAGTLATDPVSPGGPRVFVAGEAATGPAGFLGAVASGRSVARAVVGALAGGSAQSGPEWRAGRPEWLGWRLWQPGESPGRHSAHPTLTRPGSHPDWDEAAATTENVAVEAALQCLRCGRCEDCGSCSPDCPDRIWVQAGGGLVRGKRGGADGLVSSVPRVDETRCVACGRCEAICPYGAIQVLPRSDGWTCRIQARACRGCGQCTAVCPTEALTSPFDVRVPEAQVVVFHCNGGALAEEDLNWPSGGTKGVFLPCTGMVNAAQVLEAAAAGARIVLLAGCETCRFPAPHHGCPAEQTAEVAQALLRLAGSAAQVSYFAAGPGSRLVSAVRSVVDKEGS